MKQIVITLVLLLFTNTIQARRIMKIINKKSSKRILKPLIVANPIVRSIPKLNF